jgi:hypothetical protein
MWERACLGLTALFLEQAASNGVVCQKALSLFDLSIDLNQASNGAVAAY